MDVAFVHPDWPGAEGTGATHSATLIVRALADRGHEVTVFARGARADAAVSERETERAATAAGDDRPPAGAAPRAADDVAVRPLDVASASRHTATGLNRALRRHLDRGAFEGYDVVHSYLPSSMPALGRVSEESRATTVLTLNAYAGVCPKNDLRYMDRERCRERGLLRCATCAAATSRGHDEFGPLYRTVSRLGNLRQVRRGLRHRDAIDAYQALSPAVRATYADFGFPSDRIAVVPNAVDRRFRRPHKSAFQAPFDLLYVGALESHKGVERLVPALASVREAGIDARLTVVGDGGRQTAIARQVRDCGLTDSVTLAGRRPYPALPAVYASHDLFVYPGVWEEPFGRVFLEALATGTPVVATDVGAVAGIVGSAGVVTEPSVDGLTAGIETAIQDRGLATLADRCGDALEPFEGDRVLDALETLYVDGPAAVDSGWAA